MNYICRNPVSYVGQTVGTGQCVAFVKKAAGAPGTTSWRKGTKVKGNTTLTKGIAIATFDAAGRYPNKATGNHAACFDSQDAGGIWVYDQWSGVVVQRRYIPFRGVAGSASRDGDAYFVIE